MDDVRLDKYLWAVRIFKTRSDAAEAIRTNRVTVGGATCKPSREVRIGDVIAVKRMPVVYQYKVLDLVTSRQPAKNVPAYCLNITPQEELDKLDAPRETIFVFRDRGTGRPTKKEPNGSNAIRATRGRRRAAAKAWRSTAGGWRSWRCWWPTSSPTWTAAAWCACVWCTTWAKPSRETFPPSRNGGKTKRTRRRCSPAG